MTLPTAETFRQCILVKRQVLDPVDASNWTGQSVRKFLESELATGFAWKDARVGLYRAAAGEPDLTSLAAHLESLGARPCYPRIDGDGLKKGTFEFVEPAPGTAWAPGKFGILEPSEATIVPPSELALIVVPGVAFGLQGERIGRGAGFYDRYLPQAPRAVRVAIAFEFQIEARLPQNPWDQRVHWIFTEKQAIHPHL